MKNETKKAGALYILGSIFNKGIAFLAVPIFARILDTYEYGIVSTYNSWASILNMVIGCALTMGVRSAFIDYENKTGEFVSVIIKFTLAVTLVLSTINAGVICALPLNRITMLMVVLCFMHGGFWAIIDDYLQYLMMKYKYKERTFFMVLPNAIAIVASIVVIIFWFENDKYLGRIVTTSLVYVLFGSVIVFRTSKVKTSFRNAVEYIKYGLSISVPIVIHGIGLNILAQSDRVMITWLADASQTGIYSLIYSVSMIGTVIITSMEGLWVPFFVFGLKNRSVEEINEKAKVFNAFMTMSMVELVMVGPEIVKILAPQPYWEGINIIPPIILSNYLIFVYSLYVNIEHFHKKTISIAVYTAIAALLNIITNYIFIPIYGYTAAAYTTFLSYFIALILHAYKAIRLEADFLPIRLFVRSFLIIFVGTSLFYFSQDKMMIRWIFAGGIFVLYLVIYKDTVVSVLKKKPN